MTERMTTRPISLLSSGIWTLVLTCLLCSVGISRADETEVDEIVRKANHAAYYQGKDGSAVVRMVITDSQGRERTRELTILRLDEDPAEDGPKDGEQKFYVYFHRPADVNKMVFMVWKHLAGDDDRWLYLPALDLVKRIAAGDERTSFVGSDFFYEDVSGRGIHEDRHELEKTTDNFYVLKHTPKEPSAVEFRYYRTWIHKTTFIPVKIEYFDAKDQKYREYEALKVETIAGFPTVVQAKMTNHQTGTRTEMSYSKVRYDLGLPPDIFTERYLRNPPRQYLR